MAEENMDQEYGKYIGKVKWFNKKKGYGFINILNEDFSDTDVFCHFTDIKSENYKVLYPGEFVSCNIELKEDSEQHICKNVTGVYGHNLLTDNEKYIFKIIPKKENNED